MPVATDLQASKVVSEIKRRLGKDDSSVLHWKKIKKHEHKRYISRELGKGEFTFSAVAVDKTHDLITKASRLKRKSYLYFYAARFLLERISWYVRDNGGGKANLIFEYRSSMSYEALKDYFDLLRGWTPPTQIAWDYVDVDGLRIAPKRKWRLLQACDALCGTLHNALEWNDFHQIEEDYVLAIKDRFYRRGRNLTSYGLKFLHATRGSTAMRALQEEYEWLKRT